MSNDYPFPQFPSFVTDGPLAVGGSTTFTAGSNQTVSKPTYVIREKQLVDLTGPVEAGHAESLWEVLNENGSGNVLARRDSRDAAIAWIKKQYQLDDTKPEVIPPSHFFEKDGA